MVRKANVLDAEMIAILDGSVFNDSLGFDFIYNDLANNPYANYFVYEVDGKIVGYLNCWVNDNTEVLNFAVYQEYRNQGIGDLLYKELEKIAVGIISLEVRVSNENAIKFYTKRGFNKVAIRKNYYSNGEDAILMIKE